MADDKQIQDPKIENAQVQNKKTSDKPTQDSSKLVLTLETIATLTSPGTNPPDPTGPTDTCVSNAEDCRPTKD